ncbi:MAG: MBOAT family protein [Sandaracinaceae bacterium]|nr:MBOAT family protein [Sandaracinaceae bacterium]
MLFNSLDYFVFLALVFMGFWALDPRTSVPARRFGAAGRGRERLLATSRTALLLFASYVFYMSWNAVFILLIIASTLLDYGVGLALGRVEREAGRKALVAVSIAVNLGLLGLFKYADFGLVASAQLVGALGGSFRPELLHLIVPVGISFYTFQTLSYTIDVYRRRIPPHRDVLEFATYVAFFPQLVAGPIVRAKEFLPQFARLPALGADGAQRGIYLILRGLVKKVAVADFLARALLDRVWDNPSAFSSGEVWVAVYAYTWQLYGDFSGYTDIARGSARLVGFELPQNFDRPFDTTGPIEFWRRWHITLSRWVQDYLYVSLGGSRVSAARSYFNLWISFLIIGVWHGAGWTFVIFGLWHAFGVTLNRAWRQWQAHRGRAASPPQSGWKRAVLVFVSLHFFVVHWPMFRSPSLARMLEMYDRMFFANDWASLRIDPWVWAVMLGMAVTHFGPRRWLEAIEERVRSMPWPLMGLLVAAVAALLMHVAGGRPAPFIYFQF